MGDSNVGTRETNRNAQVSEVDQQTFDRTLYEQLLASYRQTYDALQESYREIASLDQEAQRLAAEKARLFQPFLWLEDGHSDPRE